MRDFDAYYILDGTQVVRVDRERCYDWLAGNSERKTIKQEDVGHYWVSTVFLTHDHAFSDDGPPILFETMVFARDENGVNLTGEYQDRCSTYDDAIAMHERVCEGVRNGLIPES